MRQLATSKAGVFTIRTYVATAREMIASDPQFTRNHLSALDGPRRDPAVQGAGLVWAIARVMNWSVNETPRGQNLTMRTIYRVTIASFIVTVALTASAAAARPSPGLPNRHLTPGATNRAVTQATIHSTICVVGYTTTVRPSESYTERLKYRQLDSGYNLHGDTRAWDYEEDHLIPLEVGGSPTSVKNLWPEPWKTTWNAGKKDTLENAMHRLVCSGAISLVRAQRVFATNWKVGYQRYVAR